MILIYNVHQLKRIRSMCKLNQSLMASLLDISVVTVSRIESSKYYLTHRQIMILECIETLMIKEPDLSLEYLMINKGETYTLWYILNASYGCSVVDHVIDKNLPKTHSSRKPCKVKGESMKEFLKALLSQIEQKNSWGKNELKELILKLMVDHTKD